MLQTLNAKLDDLDLEHATRYGSIKAKRCRCESILGNFSKDK
jgi:hypothetical protein